VIGEIPVLPKIDKQSLLTVFARQFVQEAFQ
jgi:hypothetical protein